MRTCPDAVASDACHRNHHGHRGDDAGRPACLSPDCDHPSAGHSHGHVSGHAIGHVGGAIDPGRHSGAVFWSGLGRPDYVSVSLLLGSCSSSACGGLDRLGARSGHHLCGLVSGPCLRWPVMRRCRTLALLLCRLLALCASAARFSTLGHVDFRSFCTAPAPTAYSVSHSSKAALPGMIC